jgi:hypothetical protein
VCLPGHTTPALLAGHSWEQAARASVTPWAKACPQDAGSPIERQPAVHERLKYFSDGELKQLRILPPGSRLEQGATYIDINNLRAYPNRPACL